MHYVCVWCVIIFVMWSVANAGPTSSCRSLVSSSSHSFIIRPYSYGRTHVISRPPATQQIVSVYRQFSQSNPCTATVKIFALKKEYGVEVVCRLTYRNSLINRFKWASQSSRRWWWHAVYALAFVRARVWLTGKYLRRRPFWLRQLMYRGRPIITL